MNFYASSGNWFSKGTVNTLFFLLIISFIISILNPSLQDEFLHIGLGFCIFAWALLLYRASVLWMFTMYDCHPAIICEWISTPWKTRYSTPSTFFTNPLMLSFYMLIFSCMQFAVDNLILFSLKNISHYNVFRLFLLIIPLEILLFSPCLSILKAFSNC